MNSLDLKENGFADFVSLQSLAFSTIPKEKSSIIVLVDTSLMGKPTSDILYIGKSKKPIKRIFGGYLAGYGGKTTRKINSLLFDDGYLEKVEISWIQSDDIKAEQQKLLENFKKEHGKYPVWNTSKNTKPKTQTKPKVSPKTAKTRPARK